MDDHSGTSICNAPHKNSKPSFLEIETTHFQSRRSCGQLVTDPSQVPWVLEKVGFETTVKAG